MNSTNDDEDFTTCDDCKNPLEKCTCVCTFCWWRQCCYWRL